jgi:hypothetical protein
LIEWLIFVSLWTSPIPYRPLRMAVVNERSGKNISKSQQRRCSLKGAHWLLQVRAELVRVAAVAHSLVGIRLSPVVSNLIRFSNDPTKLSVLRFGCKKG